MGNMNALTYKEVYPLIMDNKMWTGVNFNKALYFRLPDDYEQYAYVKDGIKYGKVPSICWFTNLSHGKNSELVLTKEFSGDYPRYENYNAIEVGKVADIPLDYEGVMGVPITFLGRYSPEQFEIIGFRYGNDGKDLRLKTGKCPYFRVLVRNKFPKRKRPDIGWQCPCGWVVTDITYTSIVFDAPCGRCGRYNFSEFQSKSWPVLRSLNDKKPN